MPARPAGRYPYLRKGLEITRPDQVWCADIAYAGLRDGIAYLIGDYGLD